MNKNKDKALAALLSSDTQLEAAEKSGLSVRTLRGYLDDPAFVAEYDRQRHQIVGDAARQIQIRLNDAVKTLHAIMTGDKPTPAAREKIVAARTFMEFGLRYTELADIEARLTALEEQMEDER